MKVGIRGKLLGGFLLIIIILIIVSGVTLYQMQVVKNNLEEMINVQLEIYDLSQKFALNISERSNNLRGYLLTGELQYSNRYEQLQKESQQMEEMFLAISEEEEIILFVFNSRGWSRNAIEIIIPAYERGMIEEAISYSNASYNERANELIEHATKIAAEQERSLKETSERLLLLGDTVITIVLGASGLALVLAIILGVVLAKIITNPLVKLLTVVEQVAGGNLQQNIKITSNDEVGKLGHAVNKMILSLKNLISDVNAASEHVAASAEELMASAEETSATSEEVAANIQQISSGAENQKQSVESTGKTVQEMIASLQQAIANVQAVQAASRMATTISNEGVQAINRAIEQMQVLNINVNESAKVISGLGNRSEEIGKIVEIISGIAEQTNLLALNAAIEAARAGEQGRGFAVVAEEVRKLAEQSAAAAGEISGLIVQIQTETTRAVDSMKKGTVEAETGNMVIDEAGNAFKKVLENVESVNGQIDEVATVMTQLAAGSKQISEQTNNILQIAKEAEYSSQEVAGITEEQTAAMQEISNAAQQQTELAEKLQAAIRQFKV